MKQICVFVRFERLRTLSKLTVEWWLQPHQYTDFHENEDGGFTCQLTEEARQQIADECDRINNHEWMLTDTCSTTPPDWDKNPHNWWWLNKPNEALNDEPRIKD